MKQSVNKYRLVCYVALLAILLICLLHSLLLARFQAIQATISYGEVQTITGTVKKKEIKTSSYAYYVKTTYKTILVYDDDDSIPIGASVSVRGAPEAFSEARNEGNFDFAAYYTSLGISCRIYADSITMAKAPRFLFRERLYQLQKRISAVYEAELSEQDAGVLANLCLGNKGLLDAQVKALYQSAGISHILAISGLHISVLGMSVFLLLRRLRASYLAAALTGVFLVFSFVLMSGMAVSALRAMIMYFLLMGAQVLGRTYDSFNALAIAALALLLVNPLSLFQSGFQFSFTAMVGLFVAGGILKVRRERRDAKQQVDEEDKSLPRKLLEGAQERVLMSLLLQLFLMPLTMWHYYEVPVYALFLNLLVIPLCSALLGFGLLGGIVGLRFVTLSKWILLLCHWILQIYEVSINLVNRLPFHQVITGRPKGWVFVLYYVLLMAGCLLYMRLPKECRFDRGRVIGLLAAAVLLCCLVFVPKKMGTRIDFLDVGQGDGIVLSDGAGGIVCIDGGSSDVSDVGTYRIAPFLKYHGVRSVDAWILTHADSDHYSGLLSLLEEGYPIETLLLAQAMEKDDTWAEIVAAAEANGTAVCYVKAGDVLSLFGAQMTCLYPAASDASDDTNALSQTWLFQKDDFSALFTGDLAAEQESLLLERGLLSAVTVLKVAHHGSKYSSCEAFLSVVRPLISVISCGEGNSYGHPAEEALARLAATNTTIVETMECGQITVYETTQGWRLRLFLAEE